MASAYRNANRGSDNSDSNISDAEIEDCTSSEASDTSNGDSKIEAAVPTLAQLPIELRNRILMLTSRGVSHRQRHLLNDLSSLLPHTYKDTKLDTKSNNNYNSALNALADLHSCNYIFFLEARKHAQDLYLWLAAAPNGPTIKFSVTNIHTMAELGFGGNSLKGGRGVVVFDRSFEDSLAGSEHRSLIREILRGVFCVPGKGVRGMKPFVDRVIGIYGLDGKIWIRAYEIRDTDKEKGEDGKIDLPKGARTDVTLLEIGPRMVLTPIVVLEGSFGGPVIYENKQFVSGNQLRKEALVKKSAKYADRRTGLEERVIKRKSLGLDSGSKRKRGPVDDRELFR